MCNDLELGVFMYTLCLTSSANKSLVERRRMQKQDRTPSSTLWGRTGFDLDSYARLQAEDDGWPLKTSIKKT